MYIFRQIKKDEIPELFQIIMARVSWMDEVGIHQWNETKYDECYPPAYFEAHRQAGHTFVLTDGEIDSEKADMNLYIYNWAFELVDTLKYDFPCDVFMVSDLILGENPRHIILSNGATTPLPAYYIDKAELGTGDAQIHKYNMPDLEYYQNQLQ